MKKLMVVLALSMCEILTVSAKPTWERSAPAVPTFVPLAQEKNVAFGRSEKVTNGILSLGNADSVSQYADDRTITFDGPKDIYDLKVYSAWDAGRDGFGIDKVSVRYYGETAYTQLTDVPEFPYADGSQGSQCAWLKMSEDQPFAKNVTGIKVHFSRCENSWIGLGEIEVRGCETEVFDLARAVITFDPEYVRYDGDEHEPKVTVSKENGTALTDGYELTWDSAKMVDAGIYTLTVSPSEGSTFSGSKTAYYRIWPASGTGDPDTVDTTYTWKGGDSTQWDAVTNWNSSVLECYGYPDCAKATAVFPADAVATIVGTNQTFQVAQPSVRGDVTLKDLTLQLNLSGDMWGVTGGRLTLDHAYLRSSVNKGVHLRGGAVWTFKNGAGLNYYTHFYREGDDKGATVVVQDGTSELYGLEDNRRSAPLTLAVTNGMAKFTYGAWQVMQTATIDIHDGAFLCAANPAGKNAQWPAMFTDTFVLKVDNLSLPESAAAAITFSDAGAYKKFVNVNDDYAVSTKIKVAYDRAFAEKGRLKWTPIIRFAVPAAEQTPELEAALKSMVEFVGSAKSDVGSCKVESDGDTLTVWAKAARNGLSILVR